MEMLMNETLSVPGVIVRNAQIYHMKTAFTCITPAKLLKMYLKTLLSDIRICAFIDICFLQTNIKEMYNLL